MHTRHYALALVLALIAVPAFSFCGFYVAKGDAKLWNRASQVALVHDGDRTVMTMSNDYEGEPRDFAIVIPVPTVLQKSQIHVGNRALVEHLDAYSSPRLVEYYDSDPCAPPRMQAVAAPSAAVGRMDMAKEARAKSLGVTIEAQYTVGEYDILILSAKESGGLETWLTENGYRIPEGASTVLGSYIRKNMKFFVAKVNLKEQAKLGFSYLRPIQVAYESPKFMLPIRLGTVNARGPQDLIVYALTKQGRVETTNYRTVKLPTGVDIPLYVHDRFADFYKALFSHEVRKEDMHAVFLEYAWDMSWCDPCASEPLSRDELRQLGVFWLEEGGPRGGGVNVFLSRLHVRYDRQHFPEDLVFQETADRENWQARYVLHHPWTGSSTCDRAAEYRRELRRRQEREAETLASLTGWDVASIRKTMKLTGEPVGEKHWWEKMWD